MKLPIGPVYAATLLTEFRISGVPDIVSIAQKLNLTIKEVDAEGFDGALIRAQGISCGAIAVRSSIREGGRKNFTIAHEIGHYIIPGHDSAGCVCSSADIANWSAMGQEREREADEFAAEMLLPTNYIRPIFRKSTPSLNVIQEVAEQSAASLSATAWRYCDLVSERCAVVWSKNNRISWYKPSSEFGFFLKPGREIERGTQAYDCFSGTRTHKTPQRVPADLWINESVFKEGSFVYEHSIGLPSYESVLSLLWVKEPIDKHSDYDEPQSQELDGFRFDSNRRDRR